MRNRKISKNRNCCIYATFCPVDVFAPDLALWNATVPKYRISHDTEQRTYHPRRDRIANKLTLAGTADCAVLLFHLKS